MRLALLFFAFLFYGALSDDAYNPKCVYNSGGDYLDLNYITGKGDFDKSGDFYTQLDKFLYLWQPCRNLYSTSACGDANMCQGELTNLNSATIGSLDRFTLSKGDNGTFLWTSFADVISVCTRKTQVKIVCDPNYTFPTFEGGDEISECFYAFTLTYNCLNIYPIIVPVDAPQSITIRGSDMQDKSVVLQSVDGDNNPIDYQFTPQYQDSTSITFFLSQELMSALYYYEVEFRIVGPEGNATIYNLLCDAGNSMTFGGDYLYGYLFSYFSTPYLIPPITLYLSSGEQNSYSGATVRFTLPNQLKIVRSDDGGTDPVTIKFPIIVDNPGSIEFHNINFQSASYNQVIFTGPHYAPYANIAVFALNTNNVSFYGCNFYLNEHDDSASVVSVSNSISYTSIVIDSCSFNSPYGFVGSAGNLNNLQVSNSEFSGGNNAILFLYSTIERVNVFHNSFDQVGTVITLGSTSYLDISYNEFTGGGTHIIAAGQIVYSMVSNNIFQQTLFPVFLVDRNGKSYSGSYHSVNNTYTLSISSITISTFSVDSAFYSTGDTFTDIGDVCIRSDTGVSSIIIDSSTFINNRISSSSAIISSVGTSKSTSIMILNSRFESNECYRVLDVTSASVYVENTTFINNQVSNKGCISVTSSSHLTVVDSNFYNNSALSGAAISADSTPVRVSGGEFAHNSARIDGGAVSITTSVSSESIVVEFLSSTFLNNSCSGSGGAITVSGYIPSLKFAGINASLNSADGSGGAISMNGAIFSNLALENCVISLNTAGDSGGGFLFDGQITNAMTMSNSKFEMNEAVNGGGGCAVAGKIPSLVVSGSRFYSNMAGTIGAGMNIQRQISNVSIVDSDFEGNQCQALGGGLVFQTTGVSITISGTNFTSNVGSLVGGGVHIPVGCKLSDGLYVSDSRFENNYSPLGGGFSSRGSIPIMDFDSIQFNQNSGADGACLSIDGGKVNGLRMINSEWNSNLAIRSPGIYITSNISRLDILSSNFTQNTGSYGPVLLSGYFKDGMNVKGCKFEGNSGDLGGGIVIMSNNPNSVFNFTSSSFIRNTANSGSSVYLQFGASSKLGIEKNRFEGNEGKDGNIWISNKDSTQSSFISLTDSTFNDNVGDGSVVKMYGSVNRLEVKNVKVEGNNGDSISISGTSGSIQIESSLFDSNSGSCLAMNGGVALLTGVNSTIFKGNKGVEGSGIRMVSNPANRLQLFNTTFLNNTAYNSGSAISITGSFEEVIVKRTEVSGNVGGNTGAISVSVDSSSSSSSSNRLEMDQVNLSNNVAKNGGGLWIDSLSNGTIKNSAFVGNSGENGGAFYLQSSSSSNFLGSNLTFESNNGTKGGAVFISSSSNLVQFTECKFVKNEGREGGSFYIESKGRVTISESEFEGNRGVEGGNGISMNGSVSLLRDLLYNTRNSTKRQENSISFLNVLGDSDLDLTDSTFDDSKLITVATGAKLKMTGAPMSAVSCPPSSSFSQSSDGSLTCTADPEVSDSSALIVPDGTTSVFPTGAIIGIAVGGAFVLIALVVLGLLLWNRQRKINRAEFQSVKMSVLLGNLMITDVKVGQVIGRGFFGEVYVGSWNDLAVALKGITADEEDTDAARKWKEEIKLLHKLNHPNIVRLLGLYEHQERLFMVMEFAEHGSVDSFLKKYQGQLRMEDLTRMSYEVARGMQYIEKQGVIHRDLASRNLLLDALLHVKISDFGMSREDSVYTVKSKTLPFRWCAPEVLSNGSSTIKSDVWSFGVTVWEIFSFASYPFEHMTNEQVMENTMDPRGERLMRPPLCPPSVWEIVCVCWMNDPAERPSFKEICGLYSSNFPELKVQVVMEASSSNPNSGSNIEELERDHYNNINSGRGTLPDNHNYGAIKKQSDSGGGEPLPSNYGALPPRDQ